MKIRKSCHSDRTRRFTLVELSGTTGNDSADSDDRTRRFSLIEISRPTGNDSVASDGNEEPAAK